MEVEDVLVLVHRPHSSRHFAFSFPTARLTVTSNDRAPLGSICPGNRTWVAPLSRRAYAGSRTWDLRNRDLVPHNRQPCLGLPGLDSILH